MPFQAGAIVSQLTLDRTKFSKSIKGAQKETKSLGGFIQKNSAQIKKTGMAMTAAGAVITGAIGKMVSGYVKAGDEVHKMALRTGFSTEALSELRYAAEISGASITDVEKGVKKMAKTIMDASEGLATYVRAFDRIGLSAEDLMKLGPEEQFDTIAKAIAGLESPTLRAATAQEIFGRAGTQLLPLFAEGEKGLDALRQKARDMGIVFDQEAADKAAKLNDAMTTLRESFKGVTVSIADKLVPIITKFVEGVSGVITKIKTWMEAHPKLASLITKVVLVLGGLMAVLGPVLMILPALAAGFTLLTGPIGLVAAAVVGLIALVALIIANWEPISKFFSNLWSGIKGFFIDAYTAIKDGLIAFVTGYIKLWTGLGGAVVKVITGLLRGIIGKFTGAFDKVKELATKLKDGVVGIFNKLKEKVVGGSIIPNMVNMTLMQFDRLDEGIREKVSGMSDNMLEQTKKWQMNFEETLNATQDVLGRLDGVFGQYHANRLQQMDIEYEAQRTAIENSIMSEEEKAEALADLDKKVDKERKKALRSQAKAEKATSLMAAIVNTARAVAKALPNIPLAITVGVLGAAQVALISAQPLPSFQRGGRIEEAGIVGERGPELFIPERPGEIVPLREAIRERVGASITLHFSPVFKITTLDPMTAREVTRTKIAPELLEMFRSHIMKPEFKKALGIET